MELRVRKPDGWTMASFPDAVEQVTVATEKTGEHLSFTLIGIQSSEPNSLVQGVLDADPDDDSKLSSEVPRVKDGTSLPLDDLRPR